MRRLCRLFPVPNFTKRLQLNSNLLLSLRRLVLLCTLCSVLASCALTQSQAFWARDRINALEQALIAQDYDEADDLINRYSSTLSNEVALDLLIRKGDAAGVARFVPMADVNQSVDTDGVTPLIRAVQSAPTQTREAIVRSLLAGGADPQKTDNFGRSAVSYASFGGYPALAQFLDSGGTSFYDSSATTPEVWLPTMTLEQAPQVQRPQVAASRGNVATLLRSSPLTLTGSGRPEMLFASSWVPLASAEAGNGPFAGLRFYGDGTGALLNFEPAQEQLKMRDDAHVAWDHYQGRLFFVVLSRQFAHYCRSVGANNARFGVDCIDYSGGGADLGLTLSAGLSNESARALLNNASQRSILQPAGNTKAVLQATADQYCLPRRADRQLRQGLPANAASSRAFGDWVVFDQGRFNTYSSADSKRRSCTQRQARAAALRHCRESGSNCRSIGGCTDGNATAVASVAGHQWAWLSCRPDPELAKQEALEKCRAEAGCDCQIVLVNQSLLKGKPQACGR